MQNSEFRIQSESEAGRWIASPAARNDDVVKGLQGCGRWIGSEWWGVAGRRKLICVF